MRFDIIKAPVAIGVVALLAAGPAMGGEEESPQKMRTYYFGNSLTGCTDPKDHGRLAEPAGKTWETWAFLGAGWQLWQHRHALLNGDVEIKRDDNGDLTIDPASIEHSTGWNTKQFLTEKWDAIVLQPFSMALTWKCDEMRGVKFDEETDVGDIFLALDRKAKAGEFDGIESIKDYYTDIQHIRGGLARYTAAAAFYASIFNERPDRLDWKIYNDASRYGDDRNHDALPVLEITPERAKIVNDTIWEVGLTMQRKPE